MNDETQIIGSAISRLDNASEIREQFLSALRAAPKDVARNQAVGIAAMMLKSVIGEAFSRMLKVLAEGEPTVATECLIQLVLTAFEKRIDWHFLATSLLTDEKAN